MTDIIHRDGKTISFNTGRLYAEKHQRIAARLLDNGRILFVDIDRNIDGLTADTYSRVTPEFVMNEYDHNTYVYPAPDLTGLDYADQVTPLIKQLREIASTVRAFTA